MLNGRNLQAACKVTLSSNLELGGYSDIVFGSFWYLLSSVGYLFIYCNVYLAYFFLYFESILFYLSLTPSRSAQLRVFVD